MPRAHAPVRPVTRDPGATCYQAVVGPGAGFEARRELRAGDFTDGLSNTVLVVETVPAVPSTKPADVSLPSDKALPELGGLFSGQYHVLFADGEPHCLAAEVDPVQHRSVFTRAGGEVVPVGDGLWVGGERGKVAEATWLEDENRGLTVAIADTIQDITELGSVLALRCSGREGSSAPLPG
jgi:hypothetical protein